MKEIRPGVWALRIFVGRRANGSPVQRRRLVDSGTGRVGAGVREARTEMAKMRAEVEENGGTKRTAVATGYTVAKLLDRYIAHCETQDRSPTTVHEYRRIADKVLVPKFGTMRLDDLDQEHLDALYAELRATGLKANSIRRVHSLMSSSLRFGQKKRLVRQSVAPLASPPPPVHAEVTAPTLQQVKAVIDTAEAKDENIMATAVTLAALTGVRRGELCGLRWSDIDFVTETLTVASSVYEDGSGGWGIKEPKTRQKRRLALDPVTIEALRRHRAAVGALADSLGLDVPADAFVFSISPQGSEPLRLGLVSERYAILAKKAGVNPRFHALRHFHATRAIADGHDVVTVSHRLGHSDPSMTLRIYAHALEQRDRDLAAAMGVELSLGKGA